MPGMILNAYGQWVNPISRIITWNPPPDDRPKCCCRVKDARIEFSGAAPSKDNNFSLTASVDVLIEVSWEPSEEFRPCRMEWYESTSNPEGYGGPYDPLYPDDQYQILPAGEEWRDVYAATGGIYKMFKKWKAAMDPAPGKAPKDMFGNAITCPSEGIITIEDQPGTPTRDSIMLNADGTPLLDAQGSPQHLWDTRRNLHGMVMLYDGCPGGGAPGSGGQFLGGWTPVKTLHWWQQNDATTAEGRRQSRGGARVGGQIGGIPLPATFPRFNPFARNVQR